jgi:hypothetical protein
MIYTEDVSDLYSLDPFSNLALLVFTDHFHVISDVVTNTPVLWSQIVHQSDQVIRFKNNVMIRKASKSYDAYGVAVFDYILDKKYDTPELREFLDHRIELRFC